MDCGALFHGSKLRFIPLVLSLQTPVATPLRQTNNNIIGLGSLSSRFEMRIDGVLVQ